LNQPCSGKHSQMHPRVIIIPDREAMSPLSRGAPASFSSAAESDQPFCLQSYAGTLLSKLFVARIHSWSFLILQLLGCVRSTGIHEVYLLLRGGHYSGVRILRTALRWTLDGSLP
jgi:hypothetical protein